MNAHPPANGGEWNRQNMTQDTDSPVNARTLSVRALMERYGIGRSTAFAWRRDCRALPASDALRRRIAGRDGKTYAVPCTPRGRTTTPTQRDLGAVRLALGHFERDALADGVHGQVVADLLEIEARVKGLLDWMADALGVDPLTVEPSDHGTEGVRHA